MNSSGNGFEAVDDRQQEIEHLLAAWSADVAHAHGAPPTWQYAASPKIIDSAEANHSSALELADLIRRELDAGRYEGVVVIHGTDTLAHAASQIAFALADWHDVPIVFTGAQRPLGTTSSDAEGNLRDALSCAVMPGSTGTWVAFGGHVISAVRSTKRSSHSLNGFIAHRELAAHGKMTQASAEHKLDRAHGAADLAELRSRLRAAAGRPAPEVGALTAVPGLPPALVSASLDAFPDGLILECYGAGSGPFSLSATLELLNNATSDGMPIVAVTQCEHGRVELSRYAGSRTMEQAGVWSGADLGVESAIAKLRALLRAGYTGDELKVIFDLNLLGERSD
jgi:L-asparaginase